MRIGFFGGSFDPPHRGHLAFALAATDRFSLDQVLLAPVGIQPLKDQQGADFIHRYAMTALAAQADPRLLPSLLDAPLLPAPQQDRRNYTVDTLARLQALLQIAGMKPQIFAMIGADSLLGIHKWRHPERVLSLCDWIVAARPEYKLGETPENAFAHAVAAVPASIQVTKDADEQHGEFLRLTHPDGAATHIWFLPQMHEEVSATALRAAIAREAFEGEDWDASLLPEPVAEYIRKTGLYVGPPVDRSR